jgi:hypothetical protein
MAREEALWKNNTEEIPMVYLLYVLLAIIAAAMAAAVLVIRLDLTSL